MFNSNLSQASIVADFRKNAKALIHIHAAFFEALAANAQYSESYQKYFLSFRAELQVVYDAAVNSGAYFAEGLRNLIKEELDKSFDNYIHYYEKRFSQRIS